MISLLFEEFRTRKMRTCLGQGFRVSPIYVQLYATHAICLFLLQSNPNIWKKRSEYMKMIQPEWRLFSENFQNLHKPQKTNFAIAQNDILVRLAQFLFEIGHFGTEFSLLFSWTHFIGLNEHQDLFGAKFGQQAFKFWFNRSVKKQKIVKFWREQNSQKHHSNLLCHFCKKMFIDEHKNIDGRIQ